MALNDQTNTPPEMTYESPYKKTLSIPAIVLFVCAGVLIAASVALAVSSTPEDGPFFSVALMSVASLLLWIAFVFSKSLSKPGDK